jgi:hypothetical protein
LHNIEEIQLYTARSTGNRETYQCIVTMPLIHQCILYSFSKPWTHYTHKHYARGDINVRPKYSGRKLVLGAVVQRPVPTRIAHDDRHDVFRFERGQRIGPRGMGQRRNGGLELRSRGRGGRSRSSGCCCRCRGGGLVGRCRKSRSSISSGCSSSGSDHPTGRRRRSSDHGGAGRQHRERESGWTERNETAVIMEKMHIFMVTRT